MSPSNRAERQGEVGWIRVSEARANKNNGHTTNQIHLCLYLCVHWKQYTPTSHTPWTRPGDAKKKHINRCKTIKNCFNMQKYHTYRGWRLFFASILYIQFTRCRFACVVPREPYRNLFVLCYRKHAEKKTQYSSGKKDNKLLPGLVVYDWRHRTAWKHNSVFCFTFFFHSYCRTFFHCWICSYFINVTPKMGSIRWTRDIAPQDTHKHNS